VSTQLVDPVIYRDVVARAVAELEPGEDWPTNAALGGSLTGTRDDEFRAACEGDADRVIAAINLAATSPAVVPDDDAAGGAVMSGGSWELADPDRDGEA
jgi:hypothetical protein